MTQCLTSKIFDF